MESSDEYSESFKESPPAATSAKKPAKEQDPYEYFLNKERTKRGEAVPAADSSDPSSDEEEKDDVKEDPEIAKIRANMAKRKAEAEASRKATAVADPPSSSGDYTEESPMSGAPSKKPTPEPKKTGPPAK